MRSKTYIENVILSFRKENKKRKKVTIEKNFYLLLSHTGDKIKASLVFRITKTKEKKICDINVTKEKGKYKIDYEYLIKKIKETQNNLNIEKEANNKNSFKKYFDEFKEELKKNIKNDVDTNKKALLNFEKYFIFWEDKAESDVNERTLIDFCNYVLSKQKGVGAAESRNKSGCYAIKMSITTLRKFLHYLFLKGNIKKETLQIANNFVFTNFFISCKKQLKRQESFKHFNSLEDVRDFYELILNLKEELENYLNGNFENKDYLALHLLKYKKANLLNYSRAQDFLYKIYVTEFLLLTGIRGIDFFRINIKNIKWNDEYIYFEKTKNDEDYYLYLTDYLYRLAFNIYNLAKEIMGKNTFIATTHSTLRNFFNTFYNKQYNYNINIHGFRHTLKTLATQYLNYNDLVIEEQIQHNKKGTDKNYLKKELKEKRLQLLEDYRLLIMPTHLKYYSNIEDKERIQQKVKDEINKFFSELKDKYNIIHDELIRVLLKNF